MKPAFALEGSVFIAGAVIQWLRDQLQLIDRQLEVNKQVCVQQLQTLLTQLH